MSAFSVSGQFQGRDGWQPFEVEQEAPNEDVAVEHTLSSLGSRHNLKRTQIEIEEVENR
jgi:large subunit ribosomal protein LX